MKWRGLHDTSVEYLVLLKYETHAHNQGKKDIKILKCRLITITRVAYVIYAMNTGKTNCLLIDTTVFQVQWFPNLSIRTPYDANNNLKLLIF
jgi:hypothetical protein